MFKVNEIVQFCQGHKWCPCIGVVCMAEMKGDGPRYLVGVPMPSAETDGGTMTTFIFARDKDIERPSFECDCAENATVHAMSNYSYTEQFIECASGVVAAAMEEKGNE